MWGAMVHRSGVGPEPCPVHKLTAAILARKLEGLKDDEVRQKAVVLSVAMKQEDGVKEGLRHFLDSLPRDNMLCDVSLLLGETNLARYQLVTSDVKISVEVAAVLRDQPLRRPKTGADFLVNILISLNVVLNWINPTRSMRYTRHAICSYALGRVHTLSQGIAAGWFGFLREVFRGLLEVYIKSDTFARSHGAFGCIFGVIAAPFYALLDLFRGFVIFLDRVMVGISNGCFKTDRIFVIDPMVRANVYQTTANLNELLNYDSPKESRRDQLKYALRLANNASHLFVLCKPQFPKGHWHWLEVDRKVLKAVVIRHGRDRLSLNDDEHDILIHYLDSCDLVRISFSRFCLFLGEAVKKRLERLNRSSILNRFDKKLVNTSSRAVVTPIGDSDDDEDTELLPLVASRPRGVVRARSYTA
jgi:hypothetical protein